MTYQEAVIEAARRWGGDGTLHLLAIHLLYEVGPNMFLSCLDDKEDCENVGWGRTWEAAFKDYDEKCQKKFSSLAPPAFSDSTL